MSDDYEIEKGIPIPEPNRINFGQKSELRLTLEALEVGDSFVLIGEYDYSRAHNITSRLHRKSEVRYVFRRMTGPNGESINAWRVWRAE